MRYFYLLLTLSAVPPTVTPAVPILKKALNQLSSGNYQEAAQVLALKDKSNNRCGDPLEHWCAYFRGQALLQGGYFLDAAKEFATAKQLDSRGPIASYASAKEAEALFQAGKYSLARPCLEEAIRLHSTPQLELLLARTYIELKEHSLAQKKMKYLWTRFPSHPASQVAEGYLKKNQLYGSLSFAHQLARTKNLLHARQIAAAQKQAHQALKVAVTKTEREQGLLVLAQATGKNNLLQARELYRKLWFPHSFQKVHLEAAMSWGRLELAKGSSKEAIMRLDQITQAFPATSQAKEAAFLAAWVYFNQGDWKKCALRFQKILTNKSKLPTKIKHKSLWYWGYCNGLSGNTKKSIKILEKLKKTSLKFAPQTMYWIARFSPPNNAVSIYRSLVAKFPASWYAHLAQIRLNQQNTPLKNYSWKAKTIPSTLPKQQRETVAAALMHLGLSKEAHQEIFSSKRSKISQTKRRAFVCQNLGLFYCSYRLSLRSLWKDAFTKKNSHSLALLYPRPWPRETIHAAESFKLDPYFIWAIMRRESSFDPFAISSAGAHGLMQMLLSTATKVASLSHAKAPTRQTLQSPPVILPLSAWYLAELFKRFQNAALAAAAYNGGPSTVNGWLKRNQNLELDEFVERIPYRETREYVKKVLGDYFFYRQLWGADKNSVPFSLQLPKPRPGIDF